MTREDRTQRITFVVAIGDGQETLIDHSLSLLGVLVLEPDVSVRYLYVGAEKAPLASRVRGAAERLAALDHLHLDWISRRAYIELTRAVPAAIYVVIPTPYEENYPEWFRQTWTRIKTVYSGYGPPDIGQWSSGEFELPFFAQVDYLMAQGPPSRDRLVAAGASPSRALWTGDPLGHRLRRNAVAQVEAAELLGETDSPARTRIVWAPHWTRVWDDGPGFSNWYLTVFDFLAALPEMGDAEVVFRPHGFLRSGPRRRDRLPDYASKLWLGAEFDGARSALEEFLVAPNVRVSHGTLWDDLVHATHVITDGLSMIPYALAAGHRTAVVRRPDSPRFGLAGAGLAKSCDVVAAGPSSTEWLIQQAAASESSSDYAKRLQSQHSVLDEFFPVHESAPGELLLRWVQAELPTNGRAYE
jgi:hypothetical protein